MGRIKNVLGIKEKYLEREEGWKKQKKIKENRFFLNRDVKKNLEKEEK
jgi:hypothetical protein